MSHRILIYDPDCKLYEEILSRRLPHLTIHSASRPEEAYPSIEEAEIIFSLQSIPDDLLKRAKKLIWFASMGAGNESLIRNPHLPGSVILSKTTIFGEMMAEYVFAYLLFSLRQIPKYLVDQDKRVWDPIIPGRLRGKVMGILGLGSVGREIAFHGKRFGMRILGVKRAPGPVEGVDEVFGPEDLGRVISVADYLISVLPFTPETYHFLGEKELSMMKEGALLVNIGRGKTIDERALAEILKTKKVRAVLDVFGVEPLPANSQLWGLENVIITPHVSGINIPEEVCEAFIENYEKWIKREPLVGLVNRKAGY